MLILTKLVKLSWDIYISEAMKVAVDDIVADMVNREKTDGIWSVNSEAAFGGQMCFVDQAAAEEYITRMTAAGVANGRTLLNSVIQNI